VLPKLQASREHRRHSPAEQARALAVVLREEFGVPFTFFDPETREPVLDSNSEGLARAPAQVEPGFLQEIAADGRARLMVRHGKSIQLGLLLYARGKPTLIAVGEMAARQENGAPLALESLRKWLQAVADRLRLADQLLSRSGTEDGQGGQPSSPWEALLGLDQVARRLRVHKETSKNQQRILDAAFHVLSAQTMIWVPLKQEQPALIQGDKCLTAEQCIQLAGTLAHSPEPRGPTPLLCNDVRTTSWGSRFPQIRNLLAFLVTDQDFSGWLIALNKRKNGPFRRSEAALLLPFAALLELHQRWSHRYQDLKDLLVGLTRSLTTALDAKDTYTFGHSERVARIGVELGKEMGLEGDELGDIYLAGLLHDVGKIGIKDTVLNKPGPLTAEERQHIQQHVTIGYWILAELRQIRNLLPGVLYHHERVDGTGYPDGLAGDNIPLLARILAVADAYDAMSHQRPYRDSLPYRQVEATLIQGAGTQWDKQVVDAFLRCRNRIHAIRQRGVGDSLRHAIDGALRSGSGSGILRSALPSVARRLPGNLGEPVEYGR
jgi:HD-GYP domain-containing protein (c-di-GMP phosphodiesterase class II)